MLTTKQMKVILQAGNCKNAMLPFITVENTSHCRISIRAGTGFSDLQEIELIDLNEPTGWVCVPLKDAQDK